MVASGAKGESGRGVSLDEVVLGWAGSPEQLIGTGISLREH